MSRTLRKWSLALCLVTAGAGALAQPGERILEYAIEVAVDAGGTLDFPTLQTTGVRRVIPQLPDLARPDAPMATRTTAPQQPQQRRPAPISSAMR